MLFCEELCMSCYTCVYLNICTFKKKRKKKEEIIAKEDRSSTMQSDFIIDNDLTTNPEVIANSFNEFFLLLLAKSLLKI